MNKKHQVFTAFVLLLMIAPFASALTIDSTQGTINIYNTTKIGTTIPATGLTFRVVFTDAEFGNLKNYSITVMPSVGFSSVTPFEILFVKNESVDSSTLGKYVACLDAKALCMEEKKALDISFTRCNLDLNDLKKQNISGVQSTLSSCQLDLKAVQGDISDKDKEITDLEDAKKAGENSKWIWAAVGALVGALGYHFYKNKGGNPVEKSMGEFSRHTAG